MKTILDYTNESENPTINAWINNIKEYNSLTIEGLSDKDLLFFDSNESRKLKEQSCVDFYKALKDLGITKFIWYEYNYGLIMPIRYYMQQAGFKFGDFVKFNITTIKKSNNGRSIRKNQIGQYIEL